MEKISRLYVIANFGWHHVQEPSLIQHLGSQSQSYTQWRYAQAFQINAFTGNVSNAEPYKQSNAKLPYQQG